jgi:sugar/nucleoside kinase (ribokinase family)
MGESVQVVGLGLATLDVLVRIVEMPSWEQSRGTSASGFRFDGGGLVGTAMVAVARLGVRAGFVGTAGMDEAADLKLRSFVEAGVDLSRLVRRDGPDDQVMLVWVHGETGERVFTGVKSGTRQPIRVEELDRAYLTSADYLHIDGLLHREATLQAVQWVKAAGKMVVMDGSRTRGPISDAHRQLIPYVDVLITGEGFARALTGIEEIWQAGRAVLELGPRTFVETVGERGCYTVCRDARGRAQQFHTPAFQVDVVDTTGAGDVFHGAYIVAMTRGWSARECAQFSTAVSAIKCTQLGGRAGIPTFEQAMAFLRERGIELQE